MGVVIGISLSHGMLVFCVEGVMVLFNLLYNGIVLSG